MMEPSKESINVRVERLNNTLTSSNSNVKSLISREVLFDALTVLYNECDSEYLKKSDEQILQFVEKFRQSLFEVKRLRVNLSDFEIHNVIGRGHFGEVHVVRERQTGDVYAMKILQKVDAIRQNNAAFYQEERDIMAMATSPWLTKLQYAFQDLTRLYLVMEFHSGGELFALLERYDGVLPEKFCRFYLAELTLAINAVHMMGYVHRDIKPDNILLDRLGHLKLADFGSAAKLCPKGKVTSKMPIGTPEYIAPEVLKSMEQIGSYGIECDYWSLGIIAYEMGIGTTPFNGSAVTVIYNKIMNFSSNLTFPNDCHISDSYRSLISNLLTDAKSRFGYKQCTEHSFFHEINWNSLQDSVPPFVPKINSVDDTSNFIEFEAKKSAPSVESTRRSSNFSGKNLPFIGFTYTHTLPKSKDVKLLTETYSKLKSTESGTSKEVDLLHRKLAELESGNKDLDLLKKRLTDQIKSLKTSEGNRDKLEKDLVLANNQISHLKRMIEAEHLERKEMETKALDLIKVTKRKWELDTESKVSKLNNQIENDNKRITELCTQNNELISELERCKNELTNAKEELKNLNQLQSEYKNNMAKARALNRQSVVGVQNRLEQMSSETNEQISELQEKLKGEIQLRISMENELKDYKNNDNKMKLEFETYQKENARLMSNLKKLEESCRENETLKYELSKAKDQLEVIEKEKTKLFKEKCEGLKEENAKSSKLLKDFNQTKSELEKTVSLQKSLEMKHNVEISKLKDQLAQVVQDREDLQNRYRKVRESDELNRSKVSDLEELVHRLELGVKRLEASDGQEDQISRLESQLAAAHEALAIEKQEARTAKTALWRREKELSDAELDKKIIQRELKTAETTIQQLNTQIGQFTSDIDSLKNQHSEHVTSLNEKNRELKQQIEQLNQKFEQLTKRSETNKKDLDEAQKKIQTLHETLKEKERTIEILEKEKQKLQLMQSSLQDQFNQASDEKLLIVKNYEHYKSEVAQLEMRLEQKNHDLENLKLNYSTLREACEMLESQLTDYDKLLDVHNIKQKQLIADKEDLNKQLKDVQNEILIAKQQINEEKSLRLLAEKRGSRMASDLDELKLDKEHLMEQLGNYKMMNEELTQQLNDRETENSEQKIIISQLERSLTNAKFEEREIKDEASGYLTQIYDLKDTNRKLTRQLEEMREEIEFMRLKITDLESKLKEQLIFYQQRELKSEAIQQQQNKLINYLQTKLEEHTKKKKTFTDKLFGSSKKENVAPIPAYNDNVQKRNTLATPTNRELEIKLKDEKIKNQRLIESLQRSRSEKHIKDEAKTETASALKYKSKLNAKFEGEVKISKENQWRWERKYLRLEGTVLAFYNDRDNDTPSLVFNLASEDANIFLTSELNAGECGPTADRDIPFIFKIESILTGTSHSKSTLYVMALSKQSKILWLQELKALIPPAKSLNELCNSGKLIWKFRDIAESFTSILEVDRDTLILGCEKGLISFIISDERAVILGGTTNVLQMMVSRKLNLVVLITGVERNLMRCPLRSLESLAKAPACVNPTVSLQLISNENFHLFELSKNDLMCAATKIKIVIFQYNFKVQNYIPVRMLDTAQPCSCILFREHSLVVGVNKFFEIDLRDYSAEEFLDVSDSSLSHVISAYQLNSFPVAIMDVSGMEKEFLCCFNQYGVFVDEFGRRSSPEDLKWSHLPLNVVYRKPYMFHFQLDGLEIWKLNQPKKQPYKLNLTNTQYLGPSRLIGGNGSVFMVFENGVRMLKASEVLGDDDETLVSTAADTESEFSFSNSMLEELNEIVNDGDNGRNGDLN